MTGNSAEQLPQFKLWASDWRSCRYCNARIRQAVLTDGTRTWCEEDFARWCQGIHGGLPVGEHHPFDRPGADLAAWLES